MTLQNIQVLLILSKEEANFHVESSWFWYVDRSQRHQMIRDLASREQSSDLGEAEEEEVSTEEINCLDVYTACQDEVYGASGLVGMSSVDSEQDTVNWQVRTQTLCHQHKHVLLNCDDKCNKILETCLLSWVRDLNCLWSCESSIHFIFSNHSRKKKLIWQFLTLCLKLFEFCRRTERERWAPRPGGEGWERGSVNIIC